MRRINGGCCFAEARECASNDANILWSRQIDPSVLSVDAEAGSAAEGRAVDLCLLADHVVVASTPECEHARLTARGLQVRLDIFGATILQGPVILRPRLVGPEPAARLQTLADLMRLAGVRGIDRWRLRPDARMPRLVEALRAADARREGASLREIAAHLIGPRRAADWPGDNACLKSWVRRRITLGRKLIGIGPAGILKRDI